ncbi:sulfite exporter TauE/SafE family protein [Arthrobacter sp. TMN-37]
MLEPVLILLAGFAAGMINAAVGTGTLVTFPVLLLLGYPSLVANISNNIGLVAGGLSGAWGYRRELAPNKDLLLRLLPASAAGGVAGALLLLVLPAEAFDAIVPALIALGLLMVAFGPAIQRRTARRRREGRGQPAGATGRAGLLAGVLVLGVYGGYFGAAQGVLVVGLMSAVTAIALQQINAVKNVLVTAVNAVAAGIFMLAAWEFIDWAAVALIGCGALAGGFVGARFGRRLPPVALRSVILVVGSAALVRMLFFS